MFTKNGKGLTSKGVKPICPFQQKFQSTYAYGAFSPLTGDSLVLELPECNSQNFQIFLNHLSKKDPNELKIVTLDNASFHKTKKLIIPKNIVLFFLPPYSPELNPAEKIWWSWKRAFSNHVFKDLDAISEFIAEQVSELNHEGIIQTCKYDYIFLKNVWTTL